MLSNVYKKEVEELYATPILQQTAFWSAVKKRLGTNSIAVNFNSRKSTLYGVTNDRSSLSSDVLIVLQQINRHHSVAYVPYGPELEPADEFQGLFLEELSESLRSYLPKSCILIRYDLCWKSWWAKDKDHFDEHGIWKGEPDSPAQEFRFNFNTQNWNFKKKPFPISTCEYDLSEFNIRCRHPAQKNEAQDTLQHRISASQRGNDKSNGIRRYPYLV